LLSDFGAASGFEPGSEAALALQRLEVRAFGVLLGELLERCPDGRTGLESLHQACLVPDPAERPLFAELVARLSSGQKKPAGS
jgi:hypothetical protein